MSTDITTYPNPVHAAFVRAMLERADAADARGLCGRARQLRDILHFDNGSYVGPAVLVEEHVWAWTGELPDAACCMHVRRGLDNLVFPGGVCIEAVPYESFEHAQVPLTWDDDLE